MDVDVNWFLHILIDFFSCDFFGLNDPVADLVFAIHGGSSRLDSILAFVVRTEKIVVCKVIADNDSFPF